MGEPIPLNGLSHHRTVIGDFVIYGHEYVDVNGVHSWHTTSHSSLGKVHDYWLTLGEFHSLGAHYMYNAKGENLFVIGPIVEPEKMEREALIDAITRWESKSNRYIDEAAMS